LRLGWTGLDEILTAFSVIAASPREAKVQIAGKHPSGLRGKSGWWEARNKHTSGAEAHGRPGGIDAGAKQAAEKP